MIPTREYHGRRLSEWDKLIGRFDDGLRRVHRRAVSTEPGDTAKKRPYPAEFVEDLPLSSEQIRHAAGLMRVNHCGEICAQALYEGQAISATKTEVADAMRAAADEEHAHLIWCERRLQELGARTSRLNPAWWLASLGIGAAAGLAGDKYSLGFVEETEEQVCRHLDSHLKKLPENDLRSRAVIAAMRGDEANHAERARLQGAVPLPGLVKIVMSIQARIMTTVSYWI